MNTATLISWIGNPDLVTMLSFGNSEQSACAKSILIEDGQKNLPMPKTMNESSTFLAITNSLRPNSVLPRFDRIVLLTNRPKNKDAQQEFKLHFLTFFKDQLKKIGHQQFDTPVIIHFCDINAYDFKKVYNAGEKVLKDLQSDGIEPKNLWYNITPGTIAQQSSWISLGKTFSAESHFFLSKAKKEIVLCDIPFEIGTIRKNQAAYIERERCSTSRCIGRSPSFLAALKQAMITADFPVTVLITGESGTGKELIARTIHEYSGRKKENFIAINCSMLSKELGSAELTGWKKGSFSGAFETVEGKLKKADKGTLFLDEIGDCPLDFQAELLRILQPEDFTRPTIRHFCKKGSSEKESVDVRIICATNKDLRNTSNLREDLYYRIETFRINMPSLETRKAETDPENDIDDIRDLANYFLSRYSESFPGEKHFSDLAYQALHRHTWTGNVRELQNVIARAWILAAEDEITEADILASFNSEQNHTSISSADSFEDIATKLANNDILTGKKCCDDRIAEFRHHYFAAALKETNGNKREAYTKLKVNPKTFNEYLSYSP